MDKHEMINYLNKIRSFLKLSAVCTKYNDDNPSRRIDYNNLRAVLNGLSSTRVSEEKMRLLIVYIKSTLSKEVFELDHRNAENAVIERVITETVNAHAQSLAATLIKEMGNEV